MPCSDLKRVCGPFPENIALLSISDVTTEEDAGGITVRWTENDIRGATYFVVSNLKTTERVDYKVADFLTPTASVYIALAEAGSYSIAYWKEDGPDRSDIAAMELPFLQGATGEQVVHVGIEVTHIDELVVHTRQQIYLVQDGTESDYLLTEKLGFTISG